MTICGWCEDVMVATVAPAKPAPAVSHGLCPRCLDAALARVAARPVPIGRFPVAPPAASSAAAFARA